jgi:ribonuclease PH
LNADGGTRCASITGGYVALVQAVRKLQAAKVIAGQPVMGAVAAVSCGIFEGEAVLDLDYPEDSGADADANFILTGTGGIIEVQATAEKAAFDEAAFGELMRLARLGTAALFEAQRVALG